MAKADLRIDWATHEAARYACENWHYSGTVPANKSARVGVWERGEFVGVIVFGLGASPSLGKPYGLEGNQICELTRVALKTHTNAVSRMVAIGLRFIKKQSPKLRLVVSFADQWHGHHGGIYQAGNWVYSGLTAPAQMIRLPDGRAADPRRFNGHGHNAPKPIPAGAQIVKTPPKHRYLMPLDEAMRAQIAPLAKPYPKRAKEQDAGHPPALGGVTPTRTLQSNSHGP
jgi:hypothetical protein